MVRNVINHVINLVQIFFFSIGIQTFSAHMDVVPEGNPDAWSREPFSGDIFKDEDDGMDYIFGRGAIDDKQAVSFFSKCFRKVIA